MLNSLEIRNFRNIEHLQIEKLGRVNLLAGKNNTGKSSILEAISIYASGGNMSWIFELLHNRKEFKVEFNKNSLNNDYTLENKEALSNLFYKRNLAISEYNTIYIGDAKPEKHNCLRIGFGLMELQANGKLIGGVNEAFKLNDERQLGRSYSQLFYIANGDKKAVPFALEPQALYQSMYPVSLPKPFNFVFTHQNIQSLQFKDVPQNAVLFDQIALSEKQSLVLDVLRIIEPQIEQFAFIGEGRNRKPIVKLKNEDKPVSLNSMGDGVNRLLGIALALVNSEGGYFFIDEAENGLHYSVQEQLWKIVFHLATQLNIQVFATTHSSDCISAFTKVANEDEQNEGFLIRLDNRNDKIIPTVYDEELLDIAMDVKSEVR